MLSVPMCAQRSKAPPSKTAQKGKAAGPDSLNLSPGTYMVEGQNRLLQAVFWPPHVHINRCAHII